MPYAVKTRRLRLVPMAILLSAFILAMLASCAPPKAATIPTTTTQGKVVQRARLEVTRGVKYDASYKTIPYPNGDVDPEVGACVEVVIRGYRAIGKDLQQLIHQDRRRAPSGFLSVDSIASVTSQTIVRSSPATS